MKGKSAGNHIFAVKNSQFPVKIFPETNPLNCRRLMPSSTSNGWVHFTFLKIFHTCIYINPHDIHTLKSNNILVLSRIKICYIDRINSPSSPFLVEHHPKGQHPELRRTGGGRGKETWNWDFLERGTGNRAGWVFDPCGVEILSKMMNELWFTSKTHVFVFWQATIWWWKTMVLTRRNGWNPSFFNTTKMVMMIGENQLDGSDKCT